MTEVFGKQPPLLFGIHVELCPNVTSDNSCINYNQCLAYIITCRTRGMSTLGLTPPRQRRPETHTTHDNPVSLFLPFPFFWVAETSRVGSFRSAARPKDTSPLSPRGGLRILFGLMIFGKRITKTNYAEEQNSKYHIKASCRYCKVYFIVLAYLLEREKPGKPMPQRRKPCCRGGIPCIQVIYQPLAEGSHAEVRGTIARTDRRNPDNILGVSLVSRLLYGA